MKYTPPFTSVVDLSQLKKLRVYNFRSKSQANAYLIQDHRPGIVAGERVSRYTGEVKIAGAACAAAWPSHANFESKP